MAFDIGRVDLTQAVGDTENLGQQRVHPLDHGPAVTVDDTSGGPSPWVPRATWDHNPVTHTFKRLASP